jgi:hypothetical protein
VTNEQDRGNRGTDRASGTAREPLSTAAIAEGLRPGDEVPTEENLVYSADEPTQDEEQGDEHAPLFDPAVTQRYQARWREVQTDFVDDPRGAVRQADQLVAELMQALASTFTEEREALEGRWDTGADVSTEELRIAIRRYRSFFSRLLTI